MRLVGRDAYEKAGGAVRVDLFSKQEEGEGFAEDAGACPPAWRSRRLDAEAERAKGRRVGVRRIHELQPDADPYAYRCERPEPARADEATSNSGRTRSRPN